jgi:integral membrane sensor domain MASE1
VHTITKALSCPALIAKLVLYFSLNGLVCIIWLPGGLALAALLLGGKQYAWSVFLGALLTNLIASDSFLTAAVIATGNSLEALLGAWLLKRSNAVNHVLSLGGYLKLIMAGCAASIIAALVGSTTLLLSGFLTNGTFLLNLAHWWMGDAFGIF